MLTVTCLHALTTLRKVTLSLAHQNEDVPPLSKSCEVKSKDTTQGNIVLSLCMHFASVPCRAVINKP